MTSTQPTLRCAYRYDPLDQLINQIQPDMPALQRFYCKSRLATEIQGATQHSIIQHGDLLLAQQQRLDDALDTTLLATDLQRSVLQTVKVNNPAQPIAYSPYGHRPIANGLLSLLGFNGERPDPVTGHYLLGNGYRAFNPVLMRFNSPDSWSPFGKGGINSYTYCLGNPMFLSDPTGHSPISTVAAKIVKNALKRSRTPTSSIASRLKKLKTIHQSKSGKERIFEYEVIQSRKLNLSINDGTTTFYHDNTGFQRTWINSPSLKQLSFSATKGEELQAFANSSQSSAKLISAVDKSIDDINLDNFLNDARLRHPNGDRFDKTRFHAQNDAYASAISGNELGILPNRAVNQIVRLGNYARYPNTALKDRFIHLF